MASMASWEVVNFESWVIAIAILMCMLDAHGTASYAAAGSVAAGFSPSACGSGGVRIVHKATMEILRNCIFHVMMQRTAKTARYYYAHWRSSGDDWLLAVNSPYCAINEWKCSTEQQWVCGISWKKHSESEQFRFCFRLHANMAVLMRNQASMASSIRATRASRCSSHHLLPQIVGGGGRGANRMNGKIS